MSPTAFISHASEDKDFAEPFARALREKGVDAWLDKWEIRAGDSLVEKIFGALNETGFVVAVLSPTSIAKPWVTAELDLAVVRRIQKETRIIPINLGLDRERMPGPFRALKWISVPDRTNFQAALEETLDAIFGRSIKPPLGQAPGFAEVATPNIPNLTQSDVVVLKTLFESLSHEATEFLLDTEGPKRGANDLGISDELFFESLDVLRAERYLEFQEMLFGGGVPTVGLTWRAVERCCGAWVPGYDQKVQRILAEIVNQPDSQKWNNKTLADELKEPVWLVSHVFDGLVAQGLITTGHSYMGFRCLWVDQVSPQLKRRLRG